MLGIGTLNSWSHSLLFGYTSGNIGFKVRNWDNSEYSKLTVSVTNGITIESSVGTGTVEVSQGSVTVAGDGVKTYQQLLYELMSNVVISKITYGSRIIIGSTIFMLYVSNPICYISFGGDGSGYAVGIMRLDKNTQTNNAKYTYATNTSGTTFRNDTSVILANGTQIILKY